MPSTTTGRSATRRPPLRSHVRNAALVLALALGGVAAADAMTIRQLRSLEANEKDGITYANYYLVGVIEGLREAAESAAREGRKPPFCVESRRLDPVMARSLYQGELGRNAESYEADMPVQLVLSSALRTSYRCTR